MGGCDSKPMGGCNASLFTDELDELDLLEDQRFNATYGVKEDEVIGTGTYSRVLLGWEKANPENRYAVKVVHALNMGAAYRLSTEIKSLELLAEHPGIVCLIDVCQSALGCTRLVLELCEGGDLFVRIKQKRWYSESDARICCRELFKALAFVHSKDIMHRDVKPENVLLVSRTSDTDIKLSDFGLCQLSDIQGQKPRSRETVGSRFYLAPELIKEEEYGQEVDVWAAGIIVYCLLCGSLPFYHVIDEQLYKQILQQNLRFENEAWAQASRQAPEFVQFVLQKSVSDRPHAGKVLAHSWLASDKQIIRAV